MKHPLHILHIEDSEEDCELVRQLLLKDGLSCEINRVDTRTGVFDALQNDPIDLILADCKLPNFSGLHALEIARALKPDVPFVFVSGTIGEETAIESLRNGATDYVLKDHLSRLVSAVRRAMSESEERMLCRQLQQRLREAARLEAVSTLANGIAHDFNNILTIILGHTALLGMEHDRPERVVEITDTIARAARRGSEVVQQLLAFARKSDGHAVPVDIDHSIGQMLTQMKGSIPHKIQLSFEPFRELPNILVDPAQLERILLNLIANAVDSMPDGGHIRLSTSLMAAEEIPDLLPELASENYLCLKIADNGAGMDDTTRQHIFEPFYTTKDRGRGTGLGLPVVYGLMQANNGWIDLQSELGKGTVATLFFPVPPDTVRKPVVSAVADPVLRGAETILVVEDESDVSFFLETILESHGYQVLTAGDYDRALQVFHSHLDEIDLVFSDIGLPRVDGVTLCAELKALKPGLKAIIASGYSSKEFKERFDKLGIEAFLSKPYNTQDILHCVRKTLDEAEALHPQAA